jgi:eukaryotic-like serine/threonine-protein kinase
MSLSTGIRLGPYEILAAIGAGGMGEVYRARDTRLDRTVAIKVLPAPLAADVDRLRRFEQETRTVAALDHPNILAVHDVGTHNGAPYLVSEFLEGETLRQRLHERRLAQRKAAEYALDIARGLAAAHDKGVVHRDLKPENVFVTRDGRVKILDFGLAKLARTDAAAATGDGATVSETAAGMVLGTAGYMSPEQVRGAALDHRSDIFSFGAILYEMLSGREAFKRDSSVETMNAILKEEPLELTASGLHISPALQRIVQRCLEKRPEERFQSASDLAFAIEALSGSSSGAQAQNAAAPAPARRTIKTAVAAAVILAVAAASVWLGARLMQPGPPRFKQLITGAGYVSSARFAPDGETVVYGAAWNGKPITLFSTTVSSGGESRDLGLPPADVLGISPNGTVALGLGRQNSFRWMTTATLGRMPLAGGAPRALLPNICDADVSRDGSEFAVVRCTGMERVLEFPIGKVLYRTHGWVDHPRISPQGDRVAFLDHPVIGDDRGFVAVVDISGKVSRLTGEWSGAKGLAWSPYGDEVWFSATRGSGSDPYWIYAVTPAGRQRVVFSAPSNVWLQDVSPSGKVLVLNAHSSADVVIHRPGWKSDQLLDFGGESNDALGLSDDGSLMAAVDSGIAAGPDYLTDLVPLDNPSPVRLGKGAACAISGDGKWIAVSGPVALDKFIFYSTTSGETRNFDLGAVKNIGIYCQADHDASKVLFTGVETGKPARVYLLDANSGRVRTVSPEQFVDAVLAPSAEYFVAHNERQQEYAIVPLAGGDARPVKGLASGEIPLQWEVAGGKLYVWDQKFPARIFLLDPHSGARKLWLTIAPPAPAGLLYGSVLITPDGKSYAYRYRRVLTSLFVAEGLR